MLSLFFCLFCVNSYYLFVPRFFLQKKRFISIYENNNISNMNDVNVNTTYNNNTEQIQKFIEYMKLKTFDYNEIEIWDSGEIEWEF